MDAFGDRVARAFGALGGGMRTSEHQAPSSEKIIGEGTQLQSAAEPHEAPAQAVSDWPLAQSQGFNLLTKRKNAPAESADASGDLWSVAQSVERKKRIWEEVESSDDDEFEKKPKVEGLGEGLGEGLEEEEEKTVSYVALDEEAENDEEEAEWVKQMVGMDETLDNEWQDFTPQEGQEEEDGYDRMAAPTGTDSLGRMHTSAIGDAAENFSKQAGFSQGRRDQRANRNAAAKRLLEDDKELERASSSQKKSEKEPSKVAAKGLEKGEPSAKGKADVNAADRNSKDAEVVAPNRDAAQGNDWPAESEMADRPGLASIVPEAPSESDIVPDEQPLDFPNHRSGFMARNNTAVKTPGALKRPPEAAVEASNEKRAKKKVRFTEEVTTRDEQKEQEMEQNWSGLSRGAQASSAEEGKSKSNGQSYVPPHRRAGFVRYPSRVPDYVRHPEKYTRYTLDWSDEEDLQGADNKASDEKENDRAFLQALGRLKGELGNIRFEEANGKLPRGQETAEAVDVGDAREEERSKVDMPVKFVHRKRGSLESTVHNEERSEGRSSASGSRPAFVSASVEGLTEAAPDEEEGQEGNEVQSNGQPAAFKRMANGQRPNKRYRMRSTEEDG